MSTTFPSFADLSATAPVGGVNPPTQQPQPASGAAFPPPQPAPAPAPTAPTAPTPAPAAPSAPAAASSNIAMIRRLEANGTLPQGHGFTDDLQVLQYLAEASQTPEPAPPQQTAPAETPAPSPADLSAAALSFQQAGMLAFRDGAYVASNPLATQVASALNDNLARQRAIQAELADPERFIRNYGQGFVAEVTAPLQQEIATLREQLAAVARQAVPDPATTFVQTNRPALVGPDGALTAAGQAYHAAWEAATAAGVRDRTAAHTIAHLAAKPLLNTQTPPPAQQPPAAAQKPWLQTVTTQSANPAFSAPGSIVNNGPPAGSVPVNNAGFPDFTLMAAASQQVPS